MPNKIQRRSFLKKSFALSIAVPVAMSLEEQVLLGREAGAAPAPVTPAKAAQAPLGAIGKVKISRLICGGNLISGYAHSRDLIYVSRWLRKYFTDEKIMETWALCEQHGVNTMILNPSDERAVGIYEKYRAGGGRIQYLAQIGPEKNDLATPVKQARDAGAVGVFLLGNVADEWTRSGALGKIGELISIIKSHGLISGVAGHELRVPKMVEEAGFEPDFYMKTLHPMNYWSQRRPDQNKEVIDNYSVDNYWCMDPDETTAFMRAVKRPWIAYKVLAAGAIHPRAGFRYAFEHGADFAAVGMFDFQVAEDVAMINEVVPNLEKRERAWFA